MSETGEGSPVPENAGELEQLEKHALAQAEELDNKFSDNQKNLDDEEKEALAAAEILDEKASPIDSDYARSVLENGGEKVKNRANSEKKKPLNFPDVTAESPNHEEFPYSEWKYDTGKTGKEQRQDQGKGEDATKTEKEDSSSEDSSPNKERDINEFIKGARERLNRDLETLRRLKASSGNQRVSLEDFLREDPSAALPAANIIAARIPPNDPRIKELKSVLTDEAYVQTSQTFISEFLWHPDIVKGFNGYTKNEKNWINGWRNYYKKHPEEAGSSVKNPNRVEKIWSAAQAGFKAWVKNLNPLGKDWEWRIGASLGVIEALIVSVPGGGAVRAGMNLAVAQLIYAGANAWYKREVGKTEKKLSKISASDLAEERQRRIKEVEVKHELANTRIKNLFMGISAGATYLSLYGLLTSVGPELLKSLQEGAQVPEGTTPPEPGTTSTPTSTATPTSSPTPTNTPTPSETPTPSPRPVPTPTGPAPETQAPAPTPPAQPPIPSSIPSIEAIDKIYDSLSKDPSVHILDKAAEQVQGMPTEEASGVLHEGAAAAVGAHLDQTDKIVEEVLKSQGINQAELSSNTLKELKGAVLDQMQQDANKAFLEGAYTAPDHAVEQGKTLFEQSVSNNHDKLINTAQLVLEHSKIAENQISAAINADLYGGVALDPTLFTETFTNNGSTFGHILTEQGYNLAWGSADANVLGAHIAANHHVLSEMWGRMAEAGELPADAHFPMSLTELYLIIEKANAGDPSSIQKLKDALHWIPTDQKLKILNAKAVLSILNVLKKV